MHDFFRRFAHRENLVRHEQPFALHFVHHRIPPIHPTSVEFCRVHLRDERNPEPLLRQNARLERQPIVRVDDVRPLCFKIIVHKFAIFLLHRAQAERPIPVDHRNHFFLEMLRIISTKAVFIERI